MDNLEKNEQKFDEIVYTPLESIGQNEHMVRSACPSLILTELAAFGVT